jgi:hypothetical protein
MNSLNLLVLCVFVSFTGKSADYRNALSCLSLCMYVHARVCVREARARPCVRASVWFFRGGSNLIISFEFPSVMYQNFET